MNLHRWVRMALWARRPASEKRVKLVFVVLALVLVVALIEYAGFWPDTLTTRKIAP